MKTETGNEDQEEPLPITPVIIIFLCVHLSPSYTEVYLLNGLSISHHDSRLTIIPNNTSIT